MIKICNKKENCVHPEGPELAEEEFSIRTLRSGKIGLQSMCKKCKNDWYIRNKDNHSAKAKIYREVHKEEIYLQRKRYIAANKERINTAAKLKYLKYKDAITEYRKNYYKLNKAFVCTKASEWKKANPGKVSATVNKRRAAKLQRTPNWLTQEDFQKMQRKYEMSALMTSFLGVQFHVDHIVPLQGDNVSGLHVPDNLQILLAEDNLTKGNKYSEEKGK